MYDPPTLQILPDFQGFGLISISFSYVNIKPWRIVYTEDFVYPHDKKIFFGQI